MNQIKLTAQADLVGQAVIVRAETFSAPNSPPKVEQVTIPGSVLKDLNMQGSLIHSNLAGLMAQGFDLANAVFMLTSGRYNPTDSLQVKNAEVDAEFAKLKEQVKKDLVHGTVK